MRRGILGNGLKWRYGSVKTVIPAKAGIQRPGFEEALLDSRLRGNDEIMGLHAYLNCMGCNGDGSNDLASRIARPYAQYIWCLH